MTFHFHSFFLSKSYHEEKKNVWENRGHCEKNCVLRKYYGIVGERRFNLLFFLKKIEMFVKWSCFPLWKKFDAKFINSQKSVCFRNFFAKKSTTNKFSTAKSTNIALSQREAGVFLFKRNEIPYSVSFCCCSGHFSVLLSNFWFIFRIFGSFFEIFFHFLSFSHFILISAHFSSNSSKTPTLFPL